MKKTFSVLFFAAVWMLNSGAACADSFLTLHKTPFLSGASASAKVLGKAKERWLLHGEAAGQGWYAISEFQTEAGAGFAYAYHAFKTADGSVYVRAADVMPLPNQGEKVSPGEDIYTPECDSEGLAPLDRAGHALPLGSNWIQKAVSFNLSPVLLGKTMFRGVTGAEHVPFEIRFNSVSRDAKNPFVYHVAAAANTSGTNHSLKGTFTLKKAAIFDEKYESMKNVQTGAEAYSSLTEVHNGFISGDIALLDAGKNELKGVFVGYFYLSPSKKMEPYYNDIPVNISSFKNSIFTGTWCGTPCSFNVSAAK